MPALRDHAVPPPPLILVPFSPAARRYCRNHSRSWKIDLSRGSREVVGDIPAAVGNDPAELQDLPDTAGSLLAAAVDDSSAGTAHCSRPVPDNTADK